MSTGGRTGRALAIMAAIGLTGMAGLAGGAGEVAFEWKSAHFGQEGYSAGYCGQNRIESKVTLGKGRCVLADKGKAAATIIIAANPTRSAQLAARELQYYVEKISGARLRIASDAVAPFAGPKVLVGESALTKALGIAANSLAPQEHVLRSYGDMLALLGRDEPEFGVVDYEGIGLWPEFIVTHDWRNRPELYKKIGSFYAVDEFLQRVCGVRWFMPGELGEVCPKMETIAADNLDLQLKPWTEHRSIYPPNLADYFNFWGSGKPDVPYTTAHGGWRDINLWFARVKIAGSEAFACNHSLWGEVWKKRYEKQPETWDAIKSKGYGDDPTQLCLTSPKLVDLLTQDAKEYAAGRQNVERAMGDAFPVMAHDFANWCKCDRCRRLVRPEATGQGYWNGIASDLMWGLVNNVALKLEKEQPGMKVTCCAYAEYTLPPTFPLAGNVRAMFCRVLVGEFGDPAYKPFYQAVMRDWSGKVGGLYLWEYFDHIQNNGRESNFPGIFLRAMEEDTRFLRSIGLKGAFNELNCGNYEIPNFAQDHLNFYVWIRLMTQNAGEDLKVAELLDDYCATFYGSAAAPMKNFFQLAEERFTNPEFRKLTGEQTIADWETICPPDVLAQFKALIEKAQAAAPQEPYATRVRLMREAVYGMMEKNCLKFNKILANKRIAEVKTRGAAAAPFASVPMTEEFLQISGEPVATSTRAQIERDADNLHIRMICQEPQISTLKRSVKPSGNYDETSTLFLDDSVELFIDVGRKRNGEYFQIAANANGALWEAYRRQPQPADSSFRSGVIVKVVESADSWTVDFTLPLKVVSPDGVKPGDEWGFNICRNRFADASDKARYSCWSPTLTTFHESRRFGKIVFK